VYLESLLSNPSSAPSAPTDSVLLSASNLASNLQSNRSVTVITLPPSDDELDPQTKTFLQRACFMIGSLLLGAGITTFLGTRLEHKISRERLEDFNKQHSQALTDLHEQVKDSEALEEQCSTDQLPLMFLRNKWDNEVYLVLCAKDGRLPLIKTETDKNTVKGIKLSDGQIVNWNLVKKEDNSFQLQQEDERTTPLSQFERVGVAFLVNAATADRQNTSLRVGKQINGLSWRTGFATWFSELLGSKVNLKNMAGHPLHESELKGIWERHSKNDAQS